MHPIFCHFDLAKPFVHCKLTPPNPWPGLAAMSLAVRLNVLCSKIQDKLLHRSCHVSTALDMTSKALTNRQKVLLWEVLVEAVIHFRGDGPSFLSLQLRPVQQAKHAEVPE